MIVWSFRAPRKPSGTIPARSDCFLFLTHHGIWLRAPKNATLVWRLGKLLGLVRRFFISGFRKLLTSRISSNLGLSEISISANPNTSPAQISAISTRWSQ